MATLAALAKTGRTISMNSLSNGFSVIPRSDFNQNAGDRPYRSGRFNRVDKSFA
jgi:hypothetical protein